jgi:hypothetical protein
MSLFHTPFTKQPNASFSILETSTYLIFNLKKSIYIILDKNELFLKSDGSTIKVIPKSSIQKIEILKGNSTEIFKERSVLLGAFLGFIIGLMINFIIEGNYNDMPKFPLLIATSILLGAMTRLKPHKKIIGIQQVLKITWQENEQDYFVLLNFSFEEYDEVKNSLTVFFEVEDEYYRMP